MIRHKDSGKCYIGRSVDIYARWAGHKHDAFKRALSFPIHNALRKYGVDAFEWAILLEVDEQGLVAAEARCILERNTLVPHGYNIGGAAGGFPSKALIEAMEPATREAWQETLRRVSKTGTDGMAEKRRDPTYEREYRAIKSAASRKREANIKLRAASDPLYAAQERERRRNAALKNSRTNPEASAATFRSRMLTDADFAAKVRANRAAAARKGHEKRQAQKAFVGGT